MGEDSTVRTTRQRRRPLYGGLLIAALFGGAMLVFFLADILALFERRYSIVALVPDAPGIVSGSPVWIGGKPAGEVVQLGFMPAGAAAEERIWVELELPRHVQEQIRTDSRVRLTAAALIGERVVDILPGSATAAVLRPGDTLRLEVRPSAAEVTDRAAALRAELDTLLVQVRALTPGVRTRIDETQRAFATMDAVMLEVARMRADAARNPGLALVRDTGFTASLQRARAHAAELPAAVDQLRHRVDATGDLAPAVARLQLRADTLRAQLDAASALLSQPDGFVGRFRQDAALLNAVHAARLSLDSLVAEARRNPLRYLF
jgi:phospholipid/cholesterol/gamma-HCH transport system substrate-binding protein